MKNAFRNCFLLPFQLQHRFSKIKVVKGVPEKLLFNSYGKALLFEHSKGKVLFEDEKGKNGKRLESCSFYHNNQYLSFY